MALIECPECGKQVSSKAPACPGCGVPMDAISFTPKGGRIPYTVQEASVLLSKKDNKPRSSPASLCIYGWYLDHHMDDCCGK